MIETLATVTWNGTIDNTNLIGISDTLDQLSADVWEDDDVFVTAFNNNIAKFARLTTGYPSTTSKTTECPWYLSGGIGYSNIDNNSESVYLRSVLLAVPTAFSYSNWNGNQGGMLRNTNNQIRIITSMSIQKNGIEVSLTEDPSGAVTSQSYVLNETLTGTTANGTFDYDGGTYMIILADVYAAEGDYFVNIPTSIMGNVYDTENGDGVMGSWAYNAIHNKMYSISPQIFETNDGRISIVGGAVYNVNTWSFHELPAVTGDEDLVLYASYVAWNWYLNITGNYHYHLLNVARYGMFFTYGGNTYKPVISQGVVIGYTTDMDVQSDIDDWTDISGHNISPSPPPPVPPSPDEDDDDPMTLYAAGFGAGLTHYYVFTKASGLAETIADSLGRWNPTDPGSMGKDLFRNLISMKLTKVGSVPSTGSEQVTIYGVGLEDENGVAISAPVVSGNPTISFGPYTIDPKFGDFRDYAPFTKIDMYLPFCGWVALPSHCMGKSVSGEYIIDIISCTCKAVVKCGENVVAEAAGCCGLDVPFAAENVAMKMAGATMGLVSYGKAAVETSIGVGTAVASGGSQGVKQIVSGLGSVVSAGTQMAIQANSNYTEICGKTGDGCNIGGLGSIYILIKRPLYGDYTAENNYTPAGFAHSVGYLSMKNAHVGDCTGLIVCDNIDTSGMASATERERQIIKNMLQSGIIVNSPPAP